MEVRRPHERNDAGLAHRGWLGSALAVAGAVLLFLGWFGVSGRPNLAEQMPYLASGTIPGAALVVAAAVMLAGESTQRSTDRTHAMMSELHSLLVENAPIDEPTVAHSPADTASAALVALPNGDHFHRADCALVQRKAGVEIVDADAIRDRQLTPCPACEPPS